VGGAKLASIIRSLLTTQKNHLNLLTARTTVLCYVYQTRLFPTLIAQQKKKAAARVTAKSKLVLKTLEKQKKNKKR